MLLLILACSGAPAPQFDSAPDSGDANGAPQASVLDTMPSLFAVRWAQQQSGEAQVAYWLDEEWHWTPVETVSAGDAEIIAAGLPFDTASMWQLSVDGVVVAEGDITTGSPPEGTPQPVVVSSDPTRHDEQLQYLLTSISANGFDEPVWTVILDRQARLVWAMQTPENRVTLHPRLSGDGRSILIDHNSFWGDFDDGVASTVVRVGLDGEIQQTIDTPGLHHPFVETPDGVLYWGATDGNHEDLMRLVPGQKAELLWSCAAFHERIGVEAWCRSNTLWMDPAGENMLFSFFTTETVVEIQTADWMETRWFGHLSQSWSFDDEEDAFWWQHGAQYTADGTLLVSAKTAPDVEETVIREYQLDETNQALVEVWSFGLGDGVYGAKMGEPWLLSGGNVLHNYGSTPRIREATRDGDVVWDIGWLQFSFVGRSTPINSLYDLLP